MIGGCSDGGNRCNHSSYQSFRVSCGEVRLRDVGQSLRSRDQVAGILRQHHSCRVPEQTGRDQVPVSLFGGRGVDSSGLSTESYPQGQTHSREEERVGRPVVSPHTNSRNGMEPVYAGVQENRGVLFRAPNRSLRNISESQVSSVLLTAPREHFVGHGCDVASVGRDMGVRLSADRLHIGGAAQSSAVNVRDTASSSRVAKTGVVPPPSVPAGRRSTVSTMQAEVVEAAQHQLLPLEPGYAPATRVETIQRSFQTAGFSQQVSGHLARRNRASTNKVYEAKWRVFQRWCIGRALDPCSPTLNTVLECCCYLFDSVTRSFVNSGVQIDALSHISTDD